MGFKISDFKISGFNVSGFNVSGFKIWNLRPEILKPFLYLHPVTKIGANALLIFSFVRTDRFSIRGPGKSGYGCNCGRHDGCGERHNYGDRSRRYHDGYQLSWRQTAGRQRRLPHEECWKLFARRRYNIWEPWGDAAGQWRDCKEV